MTWKRALIILALLAVVAGGLGFFWPRNHHPFLQLSGVVEIQEIRLGSKVGGRVEQVALVKGAVAEGVVVDAGTPLVTFAVPELEAQREQVQASLEAAEAELLKAQNGPRVEDKQAAKQAVEAAKAHWEVLKAGSRPEEIRESRSQLGSNEADLILAKQRLDRTQQLLTQGTAATREQLESARANHDSKLAQRDKAKTHLALLLAGNRPEEVQQAFALYKQAEANYELLRAGTRSEDIAAAEARVSQARGKVREIEANLQEAVVRAPGRVLVEVLAVRKGDLVPPNQPVVRVLRADDLWVKVYVPETQLGKVRLDQEVDVTIDSYPGRRFKGTVMLIASESEFTPRNIQSVDERRHQVFGVKVRVPNSDGIFKSGMAAEVFVPLQD